VDGSAAGEGAVRYETAAVVTIPVAPTPSSFGCARLILFDQTRS
jgi:hypothetical protein